MLRNRDSNIIFVILDYWICPKCFIFINPGQVYHYFKYSVMSGIYQQYNKCYRGTNLEWFEI